MRSSWIEYILIQLIVHIHHLTTKNVWIGKYRKNKDSKCCRLGLIEPAHGKQVQKYLYYQFISS